MADNDGVDMPLREKYGPFLNQIYRTLEYKRAQLASALFHRIFTLESGWYNGHYARRGDGTWEMDL